MELTEIYKKGEAALKAMDIGFLLDGVETEFVMVNNRHILDDFTLSQRCIDGVEATTACHVLGVDLSTPLIMSAMTMPIPAIADEGLTKVAEGLKAAGSLMWVGYPYSPKPRGIGRNRYTAGYKCKTSPGSEKNV